MRKHSCGISASLFAERQSSGLEPHWTSVYGSDLFVEIQYGEDDEEYKSVPIIQFLSNTKDFLIAADYTVQTKYLETAPFENDGGQFLVVVPVSECGSVLRKEIVNALK
jgi:hypothetical protein